MEWVALVLLVPAILIPVVLLFGFAGCGAFLSTGAAIPAITSATPLDPQTVDVRWTDTNTVPVSFEVERRKGSEAPGEPIAVAASPLLDGALEAATEYTYRVRAIRLSDGDVSPWSGEATIQTWSRAFSAGLEQNGSNASVTGDCIVQRLVPGTVGSHINLISITVRAATNGDLALSRVTISRPALAGNEFDSDAAPKDVIPSPFTVSAGLAAALPPVEFAVPIAEALLVAFDVGDPGNGRFASGVPHTMYIKEAPPGSQITEAGAQNRAGFQTRPNELWFIDAIDVATKWPVS
jgi:hypothetical protein